MKVTQTTCDIVDIESHSNDINEVTLHIIFDHDQEDGKSKCDPYLQIKTIDICKSCTKYMLENKRYIYAYGAMGNNKYYLKS